MIKFPAGTGKFSLLSSVETDCGFRALPIKWIPVSLFKRQRNGIVKLAIHLHLKPRLKMSRTVSPVTRITSWHVQVCLWIYFSYTKRQLSLWLVNMCLINYVAYKLAAWLHKIKPSVIVSGGSGYQNWPS